MEWGISRPSATCWVLPTANPSLWNRVQVSSLDCFKWDHSSQHFNSAYPACSASGGERLNLLVRHLLGPWEATAHTLRAIFMEPSLLPTLRASSFCCCQREWKHLWNWKYPSNSFWGKALSPSSLSPSLSKCPERRAKATLNMSLQNHFPGNICFQCNLSYEYLA